MKILMIAPTPFFAHRGTHIRILEEARALERLGHEIMIVTYHNGDDIANYIKTNIDVRRIRRWLFWYKKTEAGPDWQKVLLNIFLIVKTFNMVRTWKPDVLHAHLHEGILIGRFIQVIYFLCRRMPLVADFHGSLVGEMRSHGYLGVPPIGTIFRALEKWINGMGDAAVVSSQENLSTIMQSRQYKSAAEYLPDGVSINEYKSKFDKKQIRKKYNVPQDGFVVVYTGALIQNKGINHILESIPFVIKKIPKVHFVIGGFPDGWVREYIKKRELINNVTIISPLNYFELPKVNMMADVAIDPKDAVVRQASGKLLQYMAANVGIICADRPTNRQYLSDDSALFLKAIDAHTLTNAIYDLYKNNKKLINYAKNAFEDSKKCDWQRSGDRLEQIYNNII